MKYSFYICNGVGTRYIGKQHWFNTMVHIVTNLLRFHFIFILIFTSPLFSNSGKMEQNVFSWRVYIYVMDIPDYCSKILFLMCTCVLINWQKNSSLHRTSHSCGVVGSLQNCNCGLHLRFYRISIWF